MKEDTFQIGNFLTIEPGLYYTDKAIGARIEDSFIIDERGKLVSIRRSGRIWCCRWRGSDVKRWPPAGRNDP